MTPLATGTTGKLLLSAALVIGLFVVVSLISALLKRAMPRARSTAFWSQQALKLGAIVVLVAGLLVIWMADLGRLGGVAGIVTAGVAVALQRVITSFAGYIIILRSRLFTVGDRITIGGVRGDVVALGFMQTTVLEMGQPPDESADAPAVWVRSRQYTGRIVRITNDKIFDTPVYNYTREFPFVWEELHIPISFKDDRVRAEQILLEVARKHTQPNMRVAESALKELREMYPLEGGADVDPHVYYRITDNWLELTLRFIAPVRGTRPLKDQMSRDILNAFDAAGIGIASGTYEIVGVPTINVRTLNDGVAGSQRA